MSGNQESSPELTSSNDSEGSQHALSPSKHKPLPAELEVVDGEVFALQAISSQVIVKERHTSSSSKRSSLGESPKTEYYCGLGRCTPKWLQVFVDARFFTFLLCLNCFIEGALVSG